MILVCKDFEYDGKTLLNQNLISVNFDNDTTLPSSITRKMETTTMNKYKPYTDGFGTSYQDVLEFEIHIVKDVCELIDQSEMEFQPNEYDDIVSWLTSPQNNKKMKVTTENNITQVVYGYFSSVTPFDAYGVCYGIKCVFTCNSQFSYDEKTANLTSSGRNSFTINNSSSERYDYVYPVLNIKPSTNEDMFICNMSDSDVLDSGKIAVTENDSENIASLMKKIETNAATSNSTVTYITDKDTMDILLLCDKTVILFYQTDSYGIKKKCIAYYSKTDGSYNILSGGFFYCKLLKGLDISINSKILGVYDVLNRPVLFTDIGIQDEDEIYWLRLKHGNNEIITNGSFECEMTYLEPRKGMLV